MPLWQKKPKASRELTKCEKLPPAMEVFAKHLADGNISCSAAEAKGLNAKSGAPLGIDHRWVYRAQELDESDVGQHEEKERRAGMLDKLSRWPRALSIQVPILWCFVATGKKGPELYDHIAFRQHIVESYVAGCTVAVPFLMELLERASSISLKQRLRSTLLLGATHSLTSG